MAVRTALQRLTVVMVWVAAPVLVAMSLHLYEPFLASVRPRLLTAIPLACVLALMLLLLGRDSIVRTVIRRPMVWRLLVAMWCLPLVGLLRSEAVFLGEKHAVLGAEQADVARLGRHFIVGYSSLEAVTPLVARGLIGGIYITRHNIREKTADDLRSEIAGLQALRRAAGLPPLVVVADQEGGIVSHLAPQLTALPALATLVDLPADEREAKAWEYGSTHGRELVQLGVTINLAPVVDLRPPSGRNFLDFNSLIGRRAISDDPAVVTEIAANYIRGLNAAHVGATIKHFPGLGRARDDTHHFTAHIDTPVKELEATDWVPFRNLLTSSSAYLMVGHAAVTAVDPNVPASHSKRLVDGLIRSTWDYQGPIMTDDMVMGAVYRHGICQSTVASLNAGVDWLLVAFDGAQYFRIFNCALQASKRGELDEAMLARSNARLKAMSSGTPAVAGLVQTRRAD